MSGSAGRSRSLSRAVSRRETAVIPGGTKQSSAAATCVSRPNAASVQADRAVSPCRPKVGFSGILKLADMSIPCAVLSDGRRVLSENGIARALLGGRSGASKRKKKAAGAAGRHLPLFVAPKQLDPFISQELREGPLRPVEYVEGRATVIGYEANILGAVCEIWLSARAAGALQRQQLEKANRAERMLQSLRHIGIISLVDEATGYQQYRARDELQQILSAYIAEELMPWTKRFPDAFYEQLHRVWGWPYAPGNHRRNSYIGKLTNTLIYQQLPPGVLKELQERNPRDPKTKKRPRTHHEHLTPDLGHRSLDLQITAVTTLLRATPTGRKDEFTRLFLNAFHSNKAERFLRSKGLAQPSLRNA